MFKLELEKKTVLHYAFVLNFQGTAKVEAISLNTSEMRVDHINLKPTVVNKMYNLRLLQIFECIEKCKLHLPQGLDTLPDTLRYLNWPTYPLKSLPSSFMPQNLVELNMPSSQLEQLSIEFQVYTYYLPINGYVGLVVGIKKLR